MSHHKHAAAQPAGMNYIIFSCAYNEEAVIRQTLDSVCRQTILPKQWVIVNDGSKDRTGEILAEYATKHSFITVVNKENSHVPFGTEIAVNFEVAWPHFTVADWDYFVKLDCDLDFDRDDHFEYHMRKMNEDKSLGICSGITYYINPETGRQLVMRPGWHTTGAMKVYRRQCFQEIGSKIYPLLSWDGVDELKAWHRGWRTRTFFECEVNHLGKLRALQRQRGTSYYYEWGRSQFMRCAPAEYMLIRMLTLVPKIGLKRTTAIFRGYFQQFGSDTPKQHTPQECRFAWRLFYARSFGRREAFLANWRRKVKCSDPKAGRTT